MTGPTLALEHIANYDYDGVETFEVEDLHALLASELIALRNEVRGEFGVIHERIHGVRDEASTDAHRLAATVERIADQVDAIEASASSGGQSCNCGVRPDVPAGPNHGAGCPMEVTEASMAILRGMLADRTAERDEERRDVATVEHQRDAMRELAHRERTLAHDLLDQRDEARRERDAAELDAHENAAVAERTRQQLAAMRSVVEDYALHKDGCTHWGYGHLPCTCGLNDALAFTPANPEEASDA